VARPRPAVRAGGWRRKTVHQGRKAGRRRGPSAHTRRRTSAEPLLCRGRSGGSARRPHSTSHGEVAVTRFQRFQQLGESAVARAITPSRSSRRRRGLNNTFVRASRPSRRPQKRPHPTTERPALPCRIWPTLGSQRLMAAERAGELSADRCLRRIRHHAGPDPGRTVRRARTPDT